MCTKPVLSADHAAQIAFHHFAVKCTGIEELVSYDDRNFRIEGYQKSAADDGQRAIKQLFLLKVSGYIPRNTKATLDRQNRIMWHLNDAHIPVQIPLKSTKGETIVEVQLPISVNSPEKRTHFVRLMRYLPGDSWNSSVPLTIEQYFSLGEQCANLHSELQKFSKNLTTPIEEHNWVLINAPEQLKHIDIIANKSHRRLAHDVLTRFAMDYVPKLQGSNEKWMKNVTDEEFPIALTHGDPNDLNILLQSSTDGVTLFAFLDWEDTAVTRRCYDLAILLMSMLCCENPTERDVIQLGSAIIAGFQDQATRHGSPLTSSELTALTMFTATRLAHSLICGEYSYRVESPGNEYTLLTAKQGGWEKLEDLWIRRREVYQSAWSSMV